MARSGWFLLVICGAWLAAAAACDGEPAERPDVGFAGLSRPLVVPEALVRQMREVPVAEAPLPADTCLALTRREVRPQVVDGGLGLGPEAWVLGIECVSPPGKQCYAVDDGQCECSFVKDVPDPGEEESGAPGFEPAPPINPCRMVAELASGKGVRIVQALRCEGRCAAPDHSCQLHRLSARGYVLGCTCAEPLEKQIELRLPE